MEPYVQNQSWRKCLNSLFINVLGIFEQHPSFILDKSGFSYKDYAEGGKTSYMTFKVFTFMGCLIRHLPDKYFPMIRYASLLSNRWEKQYLSQARIALNEPDPDNCVKNAPPSWSERQTHYTSISPLVCLNCDAPLTFVGALFGNWNELQCLFDKAGKDPVIPSVLLRPG